MLLFTMILELSVFCVRPIGAGLFPSQRADFSATVWNGAFVIVFGGIEKDDVVLNDMWYYDFSKMAPGDCPWELRAPSLDVPDPRYEYQLSC